MAVPVPVKGTFFYAVPEGLASIVRVGCRALVPFNNRRVTGYILDIIHEPPDRDLREMEDILDEEPVFPPHMVPFFEWMADYYFHPIGMVIRSAVPGQHFKTASLTKSGSDVLKGRLIHSEETEILLWIKEHPNERLPWPLKKVFPLKDKGWLSIEDRMKKGGASNPRMLRYVRPKGNLGLKGILAGIAGRKGAKNEVEFLQAFVGGESILVTELKARFTNGSYLVNKWVKRGVLEREGVPVHIDPTGIDILPPPVPRKLHEHQQNSLNQIKRRLDRKAFSCSLLYGVTGSGKTEVYFGAVAHAILSGRQAILLAPEISLAGYLEGLFRSRLGERVAVYHSGLSKGERYYQWTRIAGGEVDLVIGARSALFAPVPDLGLIIVDEEHDSAYVQDAGGPHYHARDAAVVRARMEKAVVVLGSGTPSVQSFQNSLTERYSLLLMPDRVEKRPMPKIEVVDMKEIKDNRGQEEMISPRLKGALKRTLGQGSQAILFLNRRGFHRIYICRSCGESIRCPNCDVALTYHLDKDLLACHYCGFRSGASVECASCGGHTLRPYGFGTEKLEHELNALFPGARISRMDTDSTRKKGEAFRILKGFGRHESDILVGTQMITKGYDFPDITLVGVISADLSLGFPDFRAGERTFQLLSQVAGRAGRGNQKGRVIIQTFNPDHYVIRTAMAHDFRSFFESERDLRKQLWYPPFSHLACLRLQGDDKKNAEEAAHQVGERLRTILNGWPSRGKDLQVLGPVEAPIRRIKRKYRWQLLIKSKSVSLLKHLLIEVERNMEKPFRSGGVQVFFDMDPYQML